MTHLERRQHPHWSPETIEQIESREAQEEENRRAALERPRAFSGRILPVLYGDDLRPITD